MSTICGLPEEWAEALNSVTTLPSDAVEPEVLELVSSSSGVLGFCVCAPSVPGPADITVSRFPIFVVGARPVEIAVAPRGGFACDSASEVNAFEAHISRNLRVVMDFVDAAGDTRPAILPISVTRTMDAPQAEWRMRVLAEPSMFASAKSCVCSAITLLGAAIDCPSLPTSILFRANNAPAPAGRLYAAAKQGHFSDVLAALEDGCSTEEEEVCSLSVKLRYFALFVHRGAFDWTRTAVQP